MSLVVWEHTDNMLETKKYRVLQLSKNVQRLLFLSYMVRVLLYIHVNNCYSV